MPPVPTRRRFAALNEFGIKVNVIEGPVGAASALKMSYAGITKGVTALGSMMMLAATRAGVADKLRGELERSHPALPAELPARRPRHVRQGVSLRRRDGGDLGLRRRGSRRKKMYQAIAEFYTRIAADHEGKHEETGALAAFLKKKD